MGIYRRADSPFYWMRLDGFKRWESTGIPIHAGNADENRKQRAHAQQIYAARMTELARQRHHLPTVSSSAPTFEMFATWYETHITAKLKGREREREILKTLRAVFGPLPLDTLTRERVTEWITTRAGKVSARTVNREVDTLKSILRTAAELHHIAASPIVGLKRLRVLKPRRRLLTAAELRRLLKAADPVERALLLIGHDALLRLGDILDLRWDDISDGWIYVRDPKDPRQGDPYDVPLSPRAQAALRAITRQGEYVFSRYRGPTCERDRRAAVRKALQRLCERCKPPVMFGKAAGGISFHWATRRSGATRLIRDRKIDLKTVQELGHWKRADVVLEIYAESNRGALEKAVGQVTPRLRAVKNKKKSA